MIKILKRRIINLSFVKNGYFAVQGEAEEKSVSSVKSFEDIL